MHYTSIRTHLKPYAIVARRKTTINHAFAAAIAPHDAYDETRIRQALRDLNQNPDAPLHCAYCGDPAQTWDHVHATVKASHFSGHGHRLGNLLPCCKSCNSAKGNKDWRRFLADLDLPNQSRQASLIEAYLSRYAINDVVPDASPDYQRLLQIRTEVLALLAEADALAAVIRAAS